MVYIQFVKKENVRLGICVPFINFAMSNSLSDGKWVMMSGDGLNG
jgi:hypothetical protein